MKFSAVTTNQYVQIYDYFYSKFLKTMKKGFRVNINRKAEVIDTILSRMTYEQQNSLKLMIKYHDTNTVHKITSMSKKTIANSYEIAVRHMYEPKNIELAVPGYYPKPKEENTKGFTLLTKADFGNCTYIITALNKKSNIYYREQLMKHISNGWQYLWTLPGCGTGARMKILMAIDRWEEQGHWISFAEDDSIRYCSVCGSLKPKDAYDSYCSACGAKMNGIIKNKKE